jgi:hypothetical protein
MGETLMYTLDKLGFLDKQSELGRKINENSFSGQVNFTQSVILIYFEFVKKYLENNFSFSYDNVLISLLIKFIRYPTPLTPDQIKEISAQSEINLPSILINYSNVTNFSGGCYYIGNNQYVPSFEELLELKNFILRDGL